MYIHLPTNEEIKEKVLISQSSLHLKPVNMKVFWSGLWRSVY